jgi:Flp pilus assembly protein TadB
MFRNREERRRRLYEVIERFRQKGATSPEKAMTIQELGLPPRFEDAMHRRLGQLGVFVEVNGKYYLSEERLKQIQDQRQKARSNGAGGGWDTRKTMITLRVARLAMTFLFVILLLVNLFIQSWEIRLAASAFLVAWIVLFIVYIYYLARVRRRFSSAQFRTNP